MIDMVLVSQEAASIRDRLSELISEQAKLEGLKYQVKASAIARLMDSINPTTGKAYSATHAQTYATLDPTYGEWYRHYTAIRGAREVLEVEMITLRMIGLAVIGDPNNVLTQGIFAPRKPVRIPTDKDEHNVPTTD